MKSMNQMSYFYKVFQSVKRLVYYKGKINIDLKSKRIVFFLSNLLSQINRLFSMETKHSWKSKRKVFPFSNPLSQQHGLLLKDGTADRMKSTICLFHLLN